jgi:hypothetical protein
MVEVSTVMCLLAWPKRFARSDRRLRNVISPIVIEAIQSKNVFCNDVCFCWRPVMKNSVCLRHK